MSSNGVAHKPARWWAWSWWKPMTAAPSTLRPETAEEARLRREVESLSAALDERDRQVRGLRLDVEALNGQVRIGQLAVQQLTDVIERDRLRVQAETAEYAARIAMTTGERLQTRGAQ